MPRRLSLFTLVSLFIGLLSVSLQAQDQSLPEVENARQQFEGEINANSVYIRSGPGDNFYPTMKLDKGASVKVVGIRFDWLKIFPPEGSFCYVAKAYVEKRGDGSVGRVTKGELRVRAGSTLNAMKTSVQMQLNENDDVQIIDEQDEYFKILPPAGAYLYVKKNFVNPVKKLEETEEVKEPKVTETPTEPADSELTADQAPAAPEATEMTAAPTTQSTPTETTAAPTTQETADGGNSLAADEVFDVLETRFAETSSAPIQEQPITELLQGYELLIQGDQLPESMRRIAEHRVSTLKVREEALNNLMEVRKIQNGMQQRQVAMKAEKEELETRIKEAEVKMYTAVGALNTSSLQQGHETLYRLTDPANGRTVVYIRTNDPQYATMFGQFIGVTGQLTSDDQLKIKYVTPTLVERVDPTKLNRGVVAQFAPASMLPKATEASTVAPGEGTH
jgi:uncharacterized protein YgiM (DUF1202 family)